MVLLLQKRWGIKDHPSDVNPMEAQTATGQDNLK